MSEPGVHAHIGPHRALTGFHYCVSMCVKFRGKRTMNFYLKVTANDIRRTQEESGYPSG